MNKVILLGRLTRDPVMKNITTGKTVTRFSLAVERRFKNKDGQKEADFINIVVWGKQAEFAAQYLTKGSQISLSGRLEARSYDAQDGQRRYVTEVVADEINLVSSGQKNANAGSQQTSAPRTDNNNNMSVMGLDEDFHLMADEDDILFEAILINGLLKEGKTYQTDITDDDLFFLCNNSKLFPRETKIRGITDMKMVYVCSPLKANEERSMDDNMNRAKEWCRQASELNVLPLAPHTIFTQYLDDTIPSQRDKGLEMGIELLKQCKEIWVHGNTLSEGMISEIILAKEMNKPIIAKDMDRETYKDFMAYQGVFKEAFSNEQWELLCVGLDEGLDVSSYARSNVSADQMMERIDQLKQGIENDPEIIDISAINLHEPEPDYEEDWAQEA